MSGGARLRRLEPVAFWLLVLLAAASRFHEVDRPFDAYTLNPWREADYTLVARAFYREDMDVLHPRIAWRGDTSGRVEMEFPFLPWGAAALYHVAGERESLLRVLSAAAGALAVWVFALLARGMLGGAAAWIALLLFAANPLLVSLAGAMQPEPLTLLFSLLTVHLAFAWSRAGRPRDLLLSAGAAGLAILSKSPAAYLGLVLAFVVLRRLGPRFALDRSVRVAVLLAAVPPLLWYLHAHGIYRETGLSLGLSNEAHFLNATLLRHPRSWVLGNLDAELRYVFGWVGIGLAAAGLWLWRGRCGLAGVWYAAVALFYVAAANTSGDAWAYYYHCHSVAPAALLMGAGFGALRARGGLWQLAAGALAVGALGLAAWTAAGLVGKRFDDSKLAAMQACLPQLAQRMPAEARVVVRGGGSHDWTGRPVAYNESMAFVWLDRFGTNYPSDVFSLATVRALATDGPWYWLAQPLDLEDPEIARRARAELPLAGECGGFVLFEVPPEPGTR